MTNVSDLSYQQYIAKAAIRFGAIAPRIAYKATIPGLDEFAVRYSLSTTAAGCFSLPASHRVQRQTGSRMQLLLAKNHSFITGIKPGRIFSGDLIIKCNLSKIRCKCVGNPVD